MMSNNVMKVQKVVDADTTRWHDASPSIHTCVHFIHTANFYTQPPKLNQLPACQNFQLSQPRSKELFS